jgi:hypothetical protein
MGDIGEKILNTDLIIVILNSILDEYQIFITSLAAREKTPSFDDLRGILLQEEKQRMDINNRLQSSYFSLMDKSKNPCNGKPWQKNMRQV